MIGLYPPLKGGETHRLQHVAEVRFRLEKERDFRASMYKKYRRGTNVADGIDTALSVTSVGLSVSGVGLLSTIIAPVATGLQAGAIVCGLLGAGGKLLGRRLQAKARKHDLIRCLAESKLNTIADFVALNDDKITEEEFRLILSMIDKKKQMKAEIRGRQKLSLSEDEKKQTISACERRSDDYSPRQVVERAPSRWNQQWHLSVSCWRASSLRF